MGTHALLEVLRPHAKPFARYCAIGVTNTAIDFTLYTTLTRGWMFWRDHYLWANAFTFALVVTWSFFWNRRWTFQRQDRQHGSQYAKFVLATLGGIGIAQVILYAGVQLIHISDLLAKLISGPLVVLWNFLMYRYWAFRASRPEATALSREEDR